MATENLSLALARGFEQGKATGGRLSGVGKVIASVADRLRQERETQSTLNLLGQTEKIKAQYTPREWKPQTKEEALEFERSKVRAATPEVPPDFELYQISPAGGYYRQKEISLKDKGIDSPKKAIEPPKSVGKFNPLRVLPQFAYSQDSKSREQAIRELKQAGYPITENNIRSAIAQLQK